MVVQVIVLGVEVIVLGVQVIILGAQQGAQCSGYRFGCTLIFVILGLITKVPGTI